MAISVFLEIHDDLMDEVNEHLEGSDQDILDLFEIDPPDLVYYEDGKTTLYVWSAAMDFWDDSSRGNVYYRLQRLLSELSRYDSDWRMLVCEDVEVYEHEGDITYRNHGCGEVFGLGVFVDVVHKHNKPATGKDKLIADVFNVFDDREWEVYADGCALLMSSIRHNKCLELDLSCDLDNRMYNKLLSNFPSTHAVWVHVAVVNVHVTAVNKDSVPF